MNFRDQSEDRAQSDNIIVGVDTPTGLKFGVLGRDNQFVVEPEYTAENAVAFAIEADEYDRSQGRSVARSFLSTF